MGKQGSPLSPEMREVVVKLKLYFDRVRGDEQEEILQSVFRTSHALDIGIASVRRIMADYNRDPSNIKKEFLKRGRPSRAIGDNGQSLARSFIRDANSNGRHITLEVLQDYLKQALGDSEFSIRTLGRALDRWGFTFGKGTRSAHLKEKDYVIAARRRYLRSKLNNRSGNTTKRPEVYLDESYVNKNHSNDYIWYLEEDGPWVQKPTGKGERLIIINAITKDGWVPNAKLVFKSTKRTGDYHGQMNHEMFAKWFQEKLLPNIPKESIIIMDNATYHNALTETSAPTVNCKKEAIKNWLQINKIPISDDCLKAELVEVLNKVAPSPTYAIDEIAKQEGHDVLRTPPYHPELQPIETCWGVVKNEMARNCDFTMQNLMVQIESAFKKVTVKTCLGLIEKMRANEDDFWQRDLELYANE
ncbi:MAG: transposase [Pseudomonadota bacterium]